MVTEQQIYEKLMSVKIGQIGWEANEDVVVFNGKPIGGTITRHRREFDRWWPQCMKEMATIIHDFINGPEGCSEKEVYNTEDE